MDSPLTQQARPDVFEPKVVGLYRQLFQEVDDEERAEGFWSTLFLLKPDAPALRQILAEIDADALIPLQHQSQQILLQGVARIRASEAPYDENALDTLTVFLAAILAKKFANPSSDIIEVLAGLDNVDALFTDLVGVIEQAIKDGRTLEIRRKATRMTIAIVSGAYQTALISYFINRDFFPALMKLVHQLDNQLQRSEPLLLTGLLANYNKFEIQNQYRVRFSDFVNEDAMRAVVHGFSWTSILLRERYITIQDDTPAGWSISSTLSMVGLGSLTGGSKTILPSLTEEQQKLLFMEQPGPEAAALLTLYDFVISNKMFCHHFVNTPAEEKGDAPPFSAFLSFTSYLYQHAWRNERASLYAYLTLLILLILVEDQSIAKSICEISASVRLCQQRPPHLPPAKSDRPYMSSTIDVLIGGLNHNLRKKLDATFYAQSITVLNRVISYLGATRTKLACNWSELWRTLLSLVRFLSKYMEDLKYLSGLQSVVSGLVSLLMSALLNGEAFLPDSASYDDLFYKLVESGDALVKFRDDYAISKPDEQSSINTLINVSKHYEELIQTRKSKVTHMSYREVGKVIKQGYDTLSIDAREEVDRTEGYREADYKVHLKKITRIAVADAATVILDK